MADKAISLEQFKEALKAIRNSTISEPDLSVRFVENAPNWNAAEGEPGYIQGRTHWTELDMVDIFKGLEVSEFEEGAGQGMLPGTYDIEAGKQYIVTYNGTEFRCTSAYLGEEGVNMAVVIGNVDAVNGTGDSGEPFVLLFVLPEMVEAIGFESAIMFLDGSSSAVISLSEEGKIVHKIPPEYLPEQTHGTYENEIVFLPETTVQYNGETMGFISTDFEKIPEIGQRFIATYDGVDYECAAINPVITLQDTYVVCFGDASAIGGEEYENIPFGISILKPGSEYYNLGFRFMFNPKLNNTENHTLKVYIPKGYPKRINDNYLPHAMPYTWVIRSTTYDAKINNTTVPEVQKFYSSSTTDEILDWLKNGKIGNVIVYYHDPTEEQLHIVNNAITQINLNSDGDLLNSVIAFTINGTGKTLRWMPYSGYRIY